MTETPPARILVIEDEMAIRELLKARLEKAGYQVLLAKDGEEGLAMAQYDAPDVIVCDVIMPGEDGFGVCQRLRKKGVQVPFLFLTAKDQQNAKLSGLALGADDYITKPFDPRELEARIRALLQRRSHPPAP